MKYKVNETCIGCGLCASTCPEAFSMGILVWQLLLKKRFRWNCLQVQKMPRTDAHLALLLRSKCEMSF